MGSSKIIITAGLQRFDTVNTISDDLKLVANDLNQQRALEIVCHLDETNSYTQLHNELLSLSKKLQINPIIKLDISQNSATNNITLDIEKNAEKVTQAANKATSSLRNLSKEYTRSIEVQTNGQYTDADATMQLLHDKLSPLGKVSVKGLYDQSEGGQDSAGGSQVLNGMVATIKNARGELRTLQYEINSTGNKFRLMSSTYDDKGVTKVSQDINRLEKQLATFKQSHSAIESGLTKPMQEAEKAIDNVRKGIGFVEEADKALDKLKATAATIGTNLSAKDASFNIFNNAVNKAENFDNILKSLEMDINSLGASDKKSSLVSWISEATNGLTKLKEIEAQNGRGQEWSAQYNQVGAIIQDITNHLKIAQKEDSAFNKEFNSALKEEEKLLQAEQMRVQTARELNEQQQHEYWQGRFDETIKGLTAENTELVKMKKYYEELEQVTRNFKSSAKNVGSNLNSLQGRLTSQANNATFRNNPNDTNVQAQIKQLNELKNKYQQLQTALDETRTPEGLMDIKDKIAQLKPEFNRAINSSKELQATLRNDSFTKTHNNRIKKLSETMNSFAAANKRAIESTKLMSNGMSFADNWKSLQERLASDTISPEELKHLTEEFAIFGQEVKAQGLQGASAWDKFLSSFKTMSSYVSANMVFNFVKRQIRNLISEVQTLDNSMTELRKVTNATDEEFAAFQKRAGETARILGASISDVIDATSTFSRAGFNLPDAEKLGEIATLYKNVGDGINIEGASESIISVMKAFNIEAEEAERIIDRINNVSNNFAIDSQGLGFALQRVASAMRAANNTLDETIALTTVANEIVQNPEMVA